MIVFLIIMCLPLVAPFDSPSNVSHFVQTDVIKLTHFTVDLVVELDLSGSASIIHFLVEHVMGKKINICIKSQVRFLPSYISW